MAEQPKVKVEIRTWSDHDLRVAVFYDRGEGYYRSYPKVELDRTIEWFSSSKEGPRPYRPVEIDFSISSKMPLSEVQQLKEVIEVMEKVYADLQSLDLTENTVYRVVLEGRTVRLLDEGEAKEETKKAVAIASRYRNGFPDHLTPDKVEEIKPRLYQARRFLALHPGIDPPESDKSIAERKAREDKKIFEQKLKESDPRLGDTVWVDLKSWSGITGMILEISDGKALIQYSTNQKLVRRYSTLLKNVRVLDRVKCEDPLGEGPTLAEVIDYHARVLAKGSINDLRSIFFEMYPDTWSLSYETPQVDIIWDICKNEFELDDSQRDLLPPDRELREIELTQMRQYQLQSILQALDKSVSDEDNYGMERPDMVSKILTIEFKD